MNLIPSMRIWFWECNGLDVIGSIISIALTLLLAEISCRVVEQPILLWKERIA
jgi:peptidoglycan/LPS O-acetylase OafA/YrhL